MSDVPPSISRAWWLLILLSLVLYLTALGASPVHRHQEARVAEVAREMGVTGNHLVPRLNGMVRLNKPPLVYWAAAASYALFGGASALAARLPVALCAIACILLTAALGQRLFGARAGLLAGAVLATTPLYVYLGRRAETDVPMTLFVVLALYAFERAFREGAMRWRWVFFGAMGVAFMCKGVPGVVVPLLAGLIFLLWEGRRRELRPSPLLGGLALTLLVIAPWYAAVWLKFPSAGQVFYFETLRRLGEEAPHANPFYYYFYVTPIHLLPWSLLVPFAWIGLRRDGRFMPAARLPLAWFAGGLGFLMLLETKQPHYLLPLLPAAALLLGGGLDRAIASARWRWLTGRNLGRLTAVTALGMLLYVAVAESRLINHDSPRDACREAAAAVGKHPLLYYHYDDSACTFYIGRTVPVAADAQSLEKHLARTPGSYVLTREEDAAVPRSKGLHVLWRSEGYRHTLVLLGPAA